MDKLKLMSVIVSLSFGIVFVLLSIPLIGIGAAIHIPAAYIEPFVKSFPNLTVGIVEFLTIGLPISIFYFLTVYLIYRVYKQVNALIMAVPFIIFMFSSLVYTTSYDDFLFFFVTAFFKSLPIFVLSMLFFKIRVLRNEA